jgi:hypothetical protein
VKLPRASFRSTTDAIRRIALTPRLRLCTLCPPSDNTNNPGNAAKPAGEKKRKRRPDVGRGGTVEGKDDESSDLERPFKAVKSGGTDDGKKKHTKKSNKPKNKKSGC